MTLTHPYPRSTQEKGEAVSESIPYRFGRWLMRADEDDREDAGLIWSRHFGRYWRREVVIAWQAPIRLTLGFSVESWGDREVIYILHLGLFMVALRIDPEAERQIRELEERRRA